MKVAIIGAGNVATHLADALVGRYDIVQVLSRSEESAGRLAGRINSACQSRGCSVRPLCVPQTDPSELVEGCDLYIVAVNDDAIAEVVAATPPYRGIWAHTSGSVGIDVFQGHKADYGVFYPLQTFSRDVAVDFSKVPVMIEGSSPEVTSRLCSIAGTVSGNVRIADSQTRGAIHVAAVFACNFANLMWAEADRLLRPQGLDIRFMLPLLRATLDKLSVKSPYDAMTGPARRGDMAVIDKHLAALPMDLKPVYAMLSERIAGMYRGSRGSNAQDDAAAHYK